MSSDPDEFLKKQYELIIKLQIQESNRFWQRYGISLTITTGLIAAFAFIYSTAKTPIQFVSPSVIAFFGLLCSIIWFLQTGSASRWEDFWVEAASDIERSLSQDKVRLLPIYSERESRMKKHQKNWYRKYSIKKLALIAPIIFVGLWSVLLVLGAIYALGLTSPSSAIVGTISPLML